MKCYNCQTELIWGGDHDGGIQEIGGLIDKLAEEGDEKG